MLYASTTECPMRTKHSPTDSSVVFPLFQKALCIKKGLFVQLDRPLQNEVKVHEEEQRIVLEDCVHVVVPVGIVLRHAEPIVEETCVVEVLVVSCHNKIWNFRHDI